MAEPHTTTRQLPITSRTAIAATARTDIDSASRRTLQRWMATGRL
jgi:hypothetical protein